MVQTSVKTTKTDYYLNDPKSAPVLTNTKMAVINNEVPLCLIL